MAVGDTLSTGSGDLRAEDVDRVVKGFALQNYVFKDSLVVDGTSAWQNTFFVESAADLEGGAGSAVKGIPRNASFPYNEPTWTESSARLEKYGMEGVVSWEDAATNNIPVISRTLLRVGRAVAKAVDDEIYSQVSNHALNSVTITAGNEWDSDTLANQDPIKDILTAQMEISIDNYDAYSDVELWLSPKDHKNLLANPNVRNAGQFYTDGVTRNGKVGTISSLKVKVSNSVTADEAIVIVRKVAGTWKSAHPLTVHTITDPGKSYLIRAWELGVTQITNPNAICKITNTQKT